MAEFKDEYTKRIAQRQAGNGLFGEAYNLN
jgi:hypothetical protein